MVPKNAKPPIANKLPAKAVVPPAKPPVVKLQDSMKRRLAK